MKTLFARVYDILEKLAEAPPGRREAFIECFTLVAETDRKWNSTEFRFMGSLGEGGKFWADPEWFLVNCYPEDRNRDRVEVINQTNQALVPLFEEYQRRVLQPPDKL
jgi:hypothetical protein